MSKNELKSYLKGLNKKQLEEQVVDLYERFKPVKVYYDFVFNPKEDQLAEEAKFKIGKEYFPVNNRKPKLRRSVAQKLIKHFTTIEMAPVIIADIMLFNLETALAYTEERPIKSEAFYKSMLNSYSSALEFIKTKGLGNEFHQRCEAIARRIANQNWQLEDSFIRSYNIFLAQIQ